MDYKNLAAKLESGELSIEDISESSNGYMIIRRAAMDGIPVAQYYLGLWQEKVNKKPHLALVWYEEAEKHNYEAAAEAIQRVRKLKNEQKPPLKDIGIETVATQSASTNDQLISLNINSHNFQTAKKTLKKFSDSASSSVKLSKVPEKTCIIFDRSVKGEELNNITEQIQTHLIDIKNLNLDFIKEFRQVYIALEALDKDYIASIVAAFEAVKKVSIEEQQDRKNIKELVAQLEELVGQHEASVKVLKKFKEDIDKLKHITDIDKTYSDFEKLKVDFSKTTDNLNAVCEYCDALSKLQHLKDIDELWDITGSISEDHKQAINELDEAIRYLQEAQQHFFVEVEQKISNYREDSDRRISAFTKAQTDKLDDIDRRYTDAVQNLATEQEVKLTSIETSLKTSLDSAVQEQTLAIDQIEKTQEERFEALFAKQSSTLEQISNDQLSQLAEINKSLEEEKLALNERVNSLTQKTKFLSIVAGGAAALTVIQLLLNILGVW